MQFLTCYSIRHQISCFKATEGLHSPYRSALTLQYSVASFATLRVLSSLHRLGSAVRVATLYDFAVTLKHAIW
jgi:hypothetical protein